MASSPQPPRSRMKPTETGIRGRLFRIKKTCARVRLLELDNKEARVDIAILRRILGIGVNDLRDVLRRGATVNVDLTPMSQAPRIFQRSNCPWNVVGISMANGEPADKDKAFSNPAAYFASRRNMFIPFQRSRPLFKPEMTGMVVEALWKCFDEMEGGSVDVVKLLEKLKEQCNKDDLPAIHGTSKTLPQRFRRFFMTIPLYFTLRWGREQGQTMVSMHPGFPEEEIKKEIRRRALVLYRRRGGRRGRGREREKLNRSRSASMSSHDESMTGAVTDEGGDDDDSVMTPMSGRVPVINESAKCAVVVDTLFKDAAKAGMLVLSFDCKGTPKDDGKTEITLVQLSTLDREVWLFDVKETEGKTSLMKEGRLKELLEADNIMKVMHDCKPVAANLFRQFGVCVFNVFDTTLAYETLLYQCNLLPADRKRDAGGGPRITVSELCKLVGEKPAFNEAKMGEILENNPHLWGERPLREDLVKYAAGSVCSLVPRAFNKLDRLLHPAWQQYFDCMCEGTLLTAQTGECK